MKPLLLLLTLLLKLPAAAPPKARVAFSPLTKAAYLAARKQAVVTKPKLTFPLKKVRGRIVIPTDMGNVIFKDNPVDEGSPEWEMYDYHGYSLQLECHVVEHRQGEWISNILIDKSGRQIAIYGGPIYSLDLKSFAAVSAGISFPPYSNSIRFFHLENHHWRQVWEIEPSVDPATWEPAEIHWLSNSTLLLKKRMWTGKNPGTTYTYSKLTINQP
ncbi:hypothetical protein [Hymenobacter ruber]